MVIKQKIKYHYFNFPVWILLVLCSLVLIIFNFTNKNFNSSISFYIKDKTTTAKYFFTSEIFNYFTNIKANSKIIESLTNENKYLKQQVALLQNSKIELDYLKNRTKGISQLKNVYDSKIISYIITTNLVSRTIGGINKNLSIAIGSLHNVKPNSLVISDKGIVGYIYDVKPKTSKIMSIFDDNFRISAITNKTRVNIVITSNNTTELDVVLYSQDVSLQPGEIAYTSGLEGNFPKYIPIGIILKKEGNTKFNEQWKIKLFEDFKYLEYVHIVN